MTENASAPTPFTDAHAAWHAEVETARTAPYGPLSPTALHWLTPEATAFPGVPGLWRADAEHLVTVAFEAEDGVTRGGAAVAGTVELGPLGPLESATLAWGSIQLEVAERSGSVVLRTRDPESPDRVGYRGTATFPPDPRWVVSARYLTRPRPAVEVPSALGPGAVQHYDSPGVAEFEVNGRTVRLTLFGTPESGDLRAVFSDATGEDLTFAPARTVRATPGEEGEVVLDFNRATNPPCAYSASATCPLAPPENRLDVRIEAGELRPGTPRPGADDR